MKVYYEDVVGYTYETMMCIALTLKKISMRMKEPLVIECQTKEPSRAFVEYADKFIVIKDGVTKVIKDRKGSYE
jgi:hypothetical protein